MEVMDFTREMVPDVMDFERRLRVEEPFYNWDIDEAYRKRVEATFDDPRFANAVTLLAYENGKVVGRIDGSILARRAKINDAAQNHINLILPQFAGAC